MLKKIFFLPFLIFVILGLYFFTHYRDIVFPILHRYQPSPAAYLEKKFKNFMAPVPKPDLIEHGSRTKPKIALTFDADMTLPMQDLLKKGVVKSWYNAEIKKTLDKEQVKATVFLGGLWTKTYPNEAKALADDPLIEIGNHSYSHPAFTQNCFKLAFIGNKLDNDEVLSAQKIIKEVTGKTPKYFRFPGGCYDNIDVATIAELGLKIIHWDVVAGDGFNNNTQSIVLSVENQTQNGSIVVMHIHDGSFAPKTNEALEDFIPFLKKKGFRFVTVSEMLDDD